MRCFRRKWRHWFLRIQCWLMWHRHSWHSTAISCKALHFGKSETFVKESSIRKAAGEMALSQLVQQNLRHHTLFLWSWHFTAEPTIFRFDFLPWHSTWFHSICQRDIITPDIKLPFAQTDDSTEHVASVHAYSHIYIGMRNFTNSPKKRKV